MFWAQVAHGSCPSGASTVPNRGKHVAHVGQAACPFFKPESAVRVYAGWNLRFHLKAVDIAEG